MALYNVDQVQPYDPNAPFTPPTPLLLKPKFEPWDKTGIFAIVAEVAASILLCYGVYLLATGAYVAVKVQDYLGIISGFSQTLGGLVTLLLWRALLLPVRCMFKGVEVDVVPDLDRRVNIQLKGSLKAVGDHANGTLANFQSLNAHHNAMGQNIQNGVNPANQSTHVSIDNAAHTASTTTRSGINTTSAIILGLTIAILALVTITTAIPGLVSPLGLLPPTNDNIATIFPNSGIKTGDGTGGNIGGIDGVGGGSGGNGNGNSTVSGGAGGDNPTTTGGKGSGNGNTATGGSTSTTGTATSTATVACERNRTDMYFYLDALPSVPPPSVQQCYDTLTNSNFNYL
ncbi:hypothetical protein HDU76_003483, partial [Blyttiomyces sp. JEL0837]